jgi:hypothetical protein
VPIFPLTDEFVVLLLDVDGVDVLILEDIIII